MTLIENDSPKVQYTGPFIKGQLLPLTFPYIATEDVKMIIDDKPAIFNVDYEIIIEPNDEHPVAYPNSAYIKNDLPNAKQITLYRVTPLDQQAPFPQQSKFRSERVEQALDKLTMQQQEQEEQLSRCIIAPITLETFNGQLPAPAADQALKWNTEGTELENYDIIGEQEAFETEVNTKFEEQSTAIENRIGQFEEETNVQFSEFRNEINENLESVLDAAAKLENLDSSVQAAENAALQANAAAARADEAVVAVDQAVDEAESAADQAEEALTEVKEFIQNAEDEIGQYYSLPMFTPIWSDHILNDASYLRADTFSWHNGGIFVTAYNTLLAEFNSDKCVEESEGNVTYKRTPSGFKIADIEQHENVLTTFTMTGKSWFYVLDTEQQRFKLPRTQYSFTGIRDAVGGNVEAGLPALSSSSTGAHTHTRGTMNITGSFNVTTGAPHWCTGAFRSDGAGQSNQNNGSYNASREGATFDASRSWTGETSSNGAHSHTITDSAGVLGKSNTVQPPATQMYLYFFIGNYARPQSDIDIGELVELINERDFEGQVADGKQELTTTKNNCIKEINSTSVGGRVLKTGDTMTGPLHIYAEHSTPFALRSTRIAAETYNEIQFQDHTGARRNTIRSFYYYDENGDIQKSTLTIGSNKLTGSAPSGLMLTCGTDNTLYFEFPRCTTRATTKSTAADNRVAVIVENYLNGQSWYRVWSDGWCEQGGWIVLSGAISATNKRVTFLKPYKVKPSVYCSQNANAGVANIVVGWESTTEFSIGTTSGACTGGTNWYARGYIK